MAQHQQRPPGMESPSMSPIRDSPLSTTDWGDTPDPNDGVSPSRFRSRTLSSAALDESLSRTQSSPADTRGAPLTASAYGSTLQLNQQQQSSFQRMSLSPSKRRMSRSLSDMSHNLGASLTSLGGIPAGATEVPFDPNVAELIRLLGDSNGIAAFQLYVGESEDYARLMFWIACEEHEHNRGARALSESAVKICEQFVIASAPLNVKLSTLTARQLEDHATHADVGFFSRAQREVFHALLKAFGQFKSSSEFQLWDKSAHSPVTSRHRLAALGKTVASASGRSSAKQPLARHLSGSVRSKSMTRRFIGRLGSLGPSRGSTRKPPTPGSLTRRLSSSSLLSRGHSLAGSLGPSSEDLSIGGLQVNLHMWMLNKPSDMLEPVGLGVHCMYHKPGKRVQEGNYAQYRKHWAACRGITWTPSAKKPEKHMINLQEYLEAAESRRPVAQFWKDREWCQVLYHDGVIVNFGLKNHAADLGSVRIDRSLQAKMQDRNIGPIADVETFDGGTIISLHDRPGLALISPKGASKKKDKELDASMDGRAKDRFPADKAVLTGTERHVTLFDAVLGKFQRSRPAGYVAVNSNATLAIQWWPRPDPDFLAVGNVMLLSLHLKEGQLNARANIRPECQIYDLWFSQLNEHQVFMLMSASKNPGDFTVQLGIYSAWSHEESNPSKARFRYFSLRLGSPRKGPKNGIEQTNSLIVPMSSPLATHATTGSEHQMVLVSTMGEICSVLLGPFPSVELRQESPVRDPVFVSWHPSDAFFAVGCRAGAIHFFDAALTPLTVTLADEIPIPLAYIDVASFEARCNTVSQGTWCNPNEHGMVDRFVVSNEQGPSFAIQLVLGAHSDRRAGLLQLITEHLRHDKVGVE